MAFSTDTFRGKLVGGAARANLFDVILTAPGYVGLNTEQFSFMARSAQLPASTVGTTIVPYFGRQVKLAGDREFGEWTVSVINDETFDLRNALERWLNGIGQNSGNDQNQRGRGATESPLSYVSNATVRQYSKNGSIIKTYKFINLFPSNVGEIALDWESNNQFEQFDVTFQYDYFVSELPDGTVAN